MRLLTAVVLAATPVIPLHAQQPPGCPERAGARQRVVAAAAIGGDAAVIALRQGSWWTSRPRSFHFVWGGSPSSGQNDLLHAEITYQVAQVAALAWDWTCVSRTTAGWLGTVTAIGFGLTKELGDGIHDEGFSASTLMWESIAAAMPAMHRQWPVTEALQPKVFYWPSQEFHTRATRTPPLPTLENDYAGMRFFLSVNPARVPGRAGRWPRWLGVALGHGTPTWVSVPPSDIWYATMDIDLHGIPLHTSWWPVLASVLDQVHFPLPGIRMQAGRIDAGLF